MAARITFTLLVIAVFLTSAVTVGWAPHSNRERGLTAVVTSPSLPIALAREPVPSRVENLQRLALIAPDDAAASVLALPDDERLAPATALLTALAERTDDLVRVAQRLCREDQVFVREHGDTLITILMAAGEHAHAVEFAALGGPERGEWLARAFRLWSEQAPEKAAEAALAFNGDDAAPAAFRPWAARDALAVARFAARTDTDNARRAAHEALLAQLEASPD